MDRGRCANCGAERSSKLVNGKLPICPHCNEDAPLKLSSSASSKATPTSMASIMEYGPPVEEHDWRHRWEWLQAQYAELSKPQRGQISTDGIQEQRHKLHDFYIQAFHLKDALINDRRLNMVEQHVEDAINANPALALNADLANQEKHLVLGTTRRMRGSGKRQKPYKPRSGYIPKIITASGVSVHDGWRLKLTIKHVSDIDGLDLAKDIIKQWRMVLTGFKLI